MSKEEQLKAAIDVSGEELLALGNKAYELELAAKKRDPGPNFWGSTSFWQYVNPLTELYIINKRVVKNDKVDKQS